LLCWFRVKYAYVASFTIQLEEIAMPSHSQTIKLPTIYHSILKGLLLVIIVLNLSMVSSAQATTEAPDVFATATALIQGATLTAQSDDTGIDPIALTATAIIRDITATAEQSTGATSVPLPTEPASALSIEEAFELTATRYVLDVTATADAFPIAVEDIEEVGLLTFILAIGSMAVVLLLLIGVIVWMNRQRWSGETSIRKPKDQE
jgi:hypothetical protein